LSRRDVMRIARRFNRFLGENYYIVAT